MRSWSSSCCGGFCWVPGCLCGVLLSFQPYGDSSLPGWLASPCREDARGLRQRDLPKGQKVGTDWKASQALRGSDMAKNPKSSASHSLYSDEGLMGSTSQPVFQPFLSTNSGVALLLVLAVHGGSSTLLSFPNSSSGFSGWHIRTNPEMGRGQSVQTHYKDSCGRKMFGQQEGSNFVRRKSREGLQQPPRIGIGVQC